MRGGRSSQRRGAHLGEISGDTASPFASDPLKGSGRAFATPPTVDLPAGIRTRVETPKNVGGEQESDEVMPDELEIADGELTTTASTASDLADSAGPGESEQGQAVHDTGPAELQTKEAFQQRAVSMFLGGGGTPTATGIHAGFEEPTDGLIILAFEAAEWLFTEKKSGHGLSKDELVRCRSDVAAMHRMGSPLQPLWVWATTGTQGAAGLL